MRADTYYHLQDEVFSFDFDLAEVSCVEFVSVLN